MAAVAPLPQVDQDVLERDLVEVAAAVDLVSRGLAERVHLVNLADPRQVLVAAGRLARSRDITFRVTRGEGRVMFSFGPSD